MVEPWPRHHVGESAKQAGIGLTFDVARSLAEVEAAWRLVYWAYRRVELIDANASRVHTLPQAVAPGTAVIFGRIGPIIASTLSVVADDCQGLPVDHVFEQEMRKLRREGRRPVEIALFADRRAKLGRTAEAFMQLLRYAYHYAASRSATDMVIGLRQGDAAMCTEMFGFRLISKARQNPAMRHYPVVLMRFALDEPAPMNLHPSMQYLRDPVDITRFDQRFGFEPHRVQYSSIGEFLRRAEAKAQLAG